MPPPRVSAFKPDQLWQHARADVLARSSSCASRWVNRAWEDADGAAGRVGRGSGVCVARPLASRRARRPGRQFRPASRGGRRPPCRHHDPHSRMPAANGSGGGSSSGRLRPGVARSSASSARCARPRPPPAYPIRRPISSAFSSWSCGTGSIASFGFESLIGTGPAHRRLLEQVRLAAASAIPVLILGEPGTGKRLVARTIHHLGANRNRPLVPTRLRGPALRRARRRIVRTRAEGRRSGRRARLASKPNSQSRLSLADGTSLLIGDILALPRDLQARLTASLDGRVRLIATAAGDPEAALKHEQLRPDLYYAMTALVLRLDPLRSAEPTSRCSPSTCWSGATSAGSRCGRLHAAGRRSRSSLTTGPATYASSPASSRSHSFSRKPRQALARRPDRRRRPAGVDPRKPRRRLSRSAAEPVKPLDELLTEIERRLIETALARARQNKSRAAELLGISRPRLYRRIKELNLPDDSEPDEENHERDRTKDGRS